MLRADLTHRYAASLRVVMSKSFEAQGEPKLRQPQ